MNPLYLDICKLAVLSGVEIDRAKKEFVINSGVELRLLKEKYKITDDSRTVKPWFFKMITTENGYALSDNIHYRYFNTSMDYLQKIISRFQFRAGREQKRTVTPFMSLVKVPQTQEDHYQGFYYQSKERIVQTIRKAKEDTRRLYIGYDGLPAADKEIIRNRAWEIKQMCTEEITKISSAPITMYLVLKELDNPEYKDVYRYVFEVLFGRPDKAFYTMIKESKEDVYTLVEDNDGDIQLYNFRFRKIPILRYPVDQI